MNAIMIVLKTPRAQPELAKASGMARRPEPREALIKLANDRMSLKEIYSVI